MNLLLAGWHGVPKEYPDGGDDISSTADECGIVAVLGRTVAPGLRFNSDMFKQLLVRWIYVTNTPFYAVEDSTFWTLLAYLLSCVPNPLLD